MQTSIRFRLTGWYIVALSITLVLLGGAVFALMQAELYDWLDDTLSDRAASLASNVRFSGKRVWLSAPARSGEPGEEAANGYLLLSAPKRAAQVERLDPAVFARSAAAAAAFAGREETGTVEWRGKWRVAARPILSDGRTVAVILAARNLDELHEVMDRLLLTLLLLLPFALLVSGLGGFLLAGRVLRPVDEITHAAAAISEKDLSRRLPIRSQDELGRLATTFNTLIERLEKAFDRQRRFTADASHELRTPLAVIRAVTSQKLMQARTTEEYQRALLQVDEASAYMARLVSDLLTLARADTGHLAVAREHLDLSELLQHAAAQVGEASGRAIPVDTPGSVIIEGDAVRLTGLFLNLLENAVRHTPPEGETRVILTRVGGNAQIAVIDSGEGIPPEHLSHIFERFYRIDKSRARENGGAGLGLAIGKWVVEAHGGAIRVQSQPGAGTTITVTLPAADQKET